MNDFGLLVGRYLSALPSLSDTQLSELQLDASGRLIIAGRYLVDDASAASDPALLMLAQRRDADTTIASADGNYAPFQLDASGRLKVAAVVSVEPSDAEFTEDSANASGDVGLHVLTVRQDTLATSTSADGDYADFKVNALGELYTHDTSALAQLVLANASLDAIESSVASIDTTTQNMYTEQLDQGTTLDGIKVDTAAIAVSTASIDSELAALSKNEDDAAVDGSKGIQVFAQRHDVDSSTVSADGDLSLLHVNAQGRLKVAAASEASGAEQYSVTDALAAAGDGLATITAAATPWVDVAVLALPAGTAYIYGWQWACDANGDARIVTDDGVDVIVYKRSVQSSAQPSYSEHWSEGGRIEIPGAADLEIKLQIKKRSATGGNALGTGSMHIRTV